jgi:hypothetical protein
LGHSTGGFEMRDKSLIIEAISFGFVQDRLWGTQGAGREARNL